MSSQQINCFIRHVRCRASGATGVGNAYRIEPRESGTVFSNDLTGDTGPNIFYLPPIKEYGGGMVFHFLFGGSATSTQIYTAKSENQPDGEMEYIYDDNLSRRINYSHGSPDSNARISLMSLDTGGWVRIADEAAALGYTSSVGLTFNWYNLVADSEGRNRTIKPEVLSDDTHAGAKTTFTVTDEHQVPIVISGDYQLGQNQSGAVVQTATGLGTAPIVTLPPARTGLHFWFVTKDSTEMRIQSLSGDFIRQWSDAAGNEDCTETKYGAVNAHIQMVAIDDESWFVTHQIPEWTLVT